MKKILIINQYSENRGDRAVLNSLTRMLLKLNYKVVVSTKTPSNYKDYLFYHQNGVEFCNWGWDFSNSENPSIYYKAINKIVRFISVPIMRINFRFFRSKYLVKIFSKKNFINALKSADIVISTGGHHIATILDKDSINSQTIDISSSLIYNKKTILWSQTIGPLYFKSRLNKQFVKRILNKVDKIALRDYKTLNVLEDFGVSKSKVINTKESVFYLNSLIKSYIKPTDRKNIIGISIYNVQKRNNKQKDQYVKLISSFVDYCVKKYDLDIEFFPMELKSTFTDDRLLIKEIIEKTNEKKRCFMHVEDYDTEDHLKKILNCKYFIGHKTHSIIFSLTVGTPLISLAYHSKSTDFMSQFDLERFSIPDSELTLSKLKKMFDELTKDINYFGTHTFKVSSDFSKELIKDLKKVLA